MPIVCSKCLPSCKISTASTCNTPTTICCRHISNTLPTGNELGDFLALDVGGSTFRIALIRLAGGENAEEALQIRQIRSFVIDKKIRDLKGMAFFNWMAQKD